MDVHLIRLGDHGRYVTEMNPRFNFHGELFEIRMAVIDGLAESGYTWLSDYGAVDIRHDDYGLEVTAIHHESDAKKIEKLLGHMLPSWRHLTTYYEDHNTLEIGWKVVVTRNKENYDDPTLGRQTQPLTISQAIKETLLRSFPTIAAWIERRSVARRHDG